MLNQAKMYTLDFKSQEDVEAPPPFLAVCHTRPLRHRSRQLNTWNWDKVVTVFHSDGFFPPSLAEGAGR